MSETTAAQRGWGPGWPHCQAGKTTTIRPCGRSLRVRTEVAPAMDYLVRRFDAEVEDINGVPDDGAFACRAIRGTQTASNHSWGLALDLNWQQHPLGRSGTFEGWQVLRIHQLLRELRFFRWGGDYQHRKDEMHFEFMGTPADAAALVKRIRALEAWPAYDGKVLRRGSKGRRVGMLQKRLGLRRTYVFGAETERALRAFQADRHETVDGRCGPRSWARLKWKLA